MHTGVVTHENVCSNLGLDPSRWLGSDASVTYEVVSGQERDRCLLKCISAITEGNQTQSGIHRQPEWEIGWEQHERRILREGLRGLIPKYFGKYDYARFNGEFVKANDEELELSMLRLVQDVVGYEFLADSDTIVEFGCGTGHNLVHAYSAYAPHSSFVGLDWASSSQRLIGTIREETGIPMAGRWFDYFDPSSYGPLPPGSSVTTVCSLEQVGSAYDAFLSFILEERPKVVVHIEPLQELLNPNALTDWLSISYAQSRNYLTGYLRTLRRLEADGQLQILLAAKTGVGSFHVDGYQVCVWRPI